MHALSEGLLAAAAAPAPAAAPGAGNPLGYGRRRSSVDLASDDVNASTSFGPNVDNLCRLVASSSHG